jgi:hypothetical protein
MPNGFQGSDIEWRRIEAPLLQLDPVLQQFADSHNLILSRNYHNEPERSVRWDNGVQRLIQLCLEDSDRLTLNLWLCAFQDRGGARYWRREHLVKAKSLSEFSERLPSLLDEAYAIVNSWTADSLEFATSPGL